MLRSPAEMMVEEITIVFRDLTEAVGGLVPGRAGEIIREAAESPRWDKAVEGIVSLLDGRFSRNNMQDGRGQR